MPSKRIPGPIWEEPAKRLTEAFASAEISQAELARRAEVDPATLGDMLSGARVPRRESLTPVCRVLDVNPEWVMGTNGAPYHFPKPKAPETIPRALGPVSTRHWELGGAGVTVLIPMGLSRAQFERFKRYVAALEVECAIAWEDEGPA